MNDLYNYVTYLSMKGFVLAPADKAGNNISAICKKYYLQVILEDWLIVQICLTHIERLLMLLEK